MDAADQIACIEEVPNCETRENLKKVIHTYTVTSIPFIIVCMMVMYTYVLLPRAHAQQWG